MITILMNQKLGLNIFSKLPDDEVSIIKKQRDQCETDNFDKTNINQNCVNINSTYKNFEETLPKHAR